MSRKKPRRGPWKERRKIIPDYEEVYVPRLHDSRGMVEHQHHKREWRKIDKERYREEHGKS